MVLEILTQNVSAEKEIIREIFVLLSQIQNIERLQAFEKRKSETKMINSSINSLIEQLKIINSSLPQVLEPFSPYQKLSEVPIEKSKFVKVSIGTSLGQEIFIVIPKEEKSKFIKEYNLSRDILKRMRTKEKRTVEKPMDIKESGFYARTSNIFFLNLSVKLLDKGYFQKLRVDLRKINISCLLATYLSMSFFTAFLVFAAAIFFFIFATFFSFSLDPFGIALAELNAVGILRNFAILIFSPILTLFLFWAYPFLEIQGIQSTIESELPFVTINMAAIAGSGIEPTNIFKIIAFGDEYPATKKEMKKVINQVNLYGYDLVTALKNSARETSSKKLAELFNGLSTTISGGGNLTDFLNKRSETLLFEYRISKEKDTKSAETFMDLYISMVVTAPMVMTLLLVLMSVGIGPVIGMSPYMLGMVMIVIVAAINILFLIALQLKSKPS